MCRVGMKYFVDICVDKNKFIIRDEGGNNQLINVRKFEKLALPNLTVTELELPVVEIVKKDFSTLPKESTLGDVIRKFKETKTELIIIQDKNNRVIGTVSPTDLLYYLGDAGNGN